MHPERKLKRRFGGLFFKRFLFTMVQEKTSVFCTKKQKTDLKLLKRVHVKFLNQTRFVPMGWFFFIFKKG